jgi:DNA (cytosine-5)-methyltransferase 1
MSRPKLLDLFCCEGGASMGYHRAGFDVYGVDLFDQFSQKRYPFPSLKGDALDALEWVVSNKAAPSFRAFGDELLSGRDFDAIAASPPCQHASAGTRAQDRSKYPRLIEPTRELLIQTGLPYVIENVKGADLREPILLCGTMFGLRAIDDDGTPLEMWRHRLFESNVDIASGIVGLPAPTLPGWRGFCRHGWYAPQVAGSYGGARRDKDEARNVRHGGYVPSKRVQQELLGIDWMTERGMHQSIPPAYTEHIGRHLLAHIEQEKAA